MIIMKFRATTQEMRT